MNTDNKKKLPKALSIDGGRSILDWWGVGYILFWENRVSVFKALCRQSFSFFLFDSCI